MRVIIAGGSGLIGRRLAQLLHDEGDEVFVLSRHPERHRDRLPLAVQLVRWDGHTPDGWVHLLSRDDVAVVNLAGQNIEETRWTKAFQQVARDSRVTATRAIVAGIRLAPQPPLMLVQASGVGYYGNNTKDAPLTSDSPPGTDWLAQLCVEWEAAASESPVRTCVLRMGYVLDPRGGTYPQYVQLVNRLAAYMGTGQQWLPWIHYADVSHIIRQFIRTEAAAGAYNVVSPTQTRNREFVGTLARLKGVRPLYAVPSWVVRWALGAAADIVLNGQYVVPHRLLEMGTTFRYGNLDAAFRHLLAQ